VAFDGPSHVSAASVTRAQMDQIAKDFGVNVKASDAAPRGGNAGPRSDIGSVPRPRIAMYQPWTGGNMDEGWTRWVLEQYGFNNTSIHNDDIRAGKLRQKFDVIILADQDPRGIVDGFDAAAIRPEYRGGIGEAGVSSLKRFVADGGTLVTLGNAWRPRDRGNADSRTQSQEGMTRDQHFAPGAILRLEVDTRHPIGYGVAANTYGFYVNSPFFQLTDGFTSQRPAVIARYPERERARVGLAEGRGADGRPRGSRLDRYEPGHGRAVRPAAATSCADARHVPAALQRLVPRRDG